MKLTTKTKPSSNKTEKGSWNNFDSKVLARFVRTFNPQFVDVLDPELEYWQNCEDTVVIRMPNPPPSWTVFMALEELCADEFSIQTDGKKHVVIRMWWD